MGAELRKLREARATRDLESGNGRRRYSTSLSISPYLSLLSLSLPPPLLLLRMILLGLLPLVLLLVLPTMLLLALLLLLVLMTVLPLMQLVLMLLVLMQ
jgi:hypothetical protein